MTSFSDALRVRAGKVRLGDLDPAGTPGARNKAKAQERIARNLERIDELQYLLYAEGRRSLLLVLQGMDAAGKDGVIRKVMTAFNPQGCQTHAFKAPTAEELSHDFLWRVHKVTPRRGEVAIFNRSHYEDVLVVRVHELVPKAQWELRYDAINAFEEQLHQSGTRILKFFLHISREEQRERMLARLDDDAKHWKFNAGDLDERLHWDEYQRAFEVLLERCTSKHAPWFIVPANRKWYRDLAVSEIVRETLEAMAPRTPEVTIDVKALRARLAKD